MARSSGTIRVEGLSELIKDISGADKATRRNITKELRKLSKIVSDEAKSIADQKGLRVSGALIKGIKPSVRRNVASVRGTATRDGKVNYHSIHEYGMRGSGKYGPRATINPALEAKRLEVYQGFRDMMNTTLKQNRL